MKSAVGLAVKGVALCCPACKRPLQEPLHCAGCSASYPKVNDIPVLINESNSVFRIDDIIADRKSSPPNLFVSWLDRALPSGTVNVATARNCQRIAAMLPQEAKVLIIGAGTKGPGIKYLDELGACIINTDVYPSPEQDVVVDAHDIPFWDNTFDCVIAQTVLEHVVDPVRCVSEMHRVLKPDGLIYADTPFVQQVHMAEFDFMRFTHLGHRRLFRDFLECDSGVACGPGTALAWSWRYFWKSFFRTRGLAWYAVGALARLTSFWAPLFDYFLAEKPGSYDGASGFYFLGRKSTHRMSDRELLEQFRGVK